jgi:hypothetical protein
LKGNAANGFRTGSFNLDVLELPEFSSINNPLEGGGFHESRAIRIRTGNLAIDQNVKSRTFILSTDAGDITVNSKIDASGETGGKISLSASGSLTVSSDAELTVKGEKFDSAGKGGLIELFAGCKSTAKSTRLPDSRSPPVRKLICR